MQLHADLSLPARVRTEDLEWVSSPSPGVERRMIERDGDEVARATSLVRYAPGTRFPPHRHELGEEFLVLEGVFSDENGDFPAGTYVRNPPGSQHAPHCDDGCTIFVKLRQFDLEDLESVCIDTHTAPWEAKASGVEAQRLHRFRTEHVELVRLAAGASRSVGGPDGLTELLILEGELVRDGRRETRGTWLRVPAGRHSVASAPNGALFWRKAGHVR